MYNQGMGGVDICDRLLASSRPRLRSKKWRWNLFAHVINLSIVAAYRFYKHVNKTNTTPLQFRREIARALVKSENIIKRQGGPTAPPSVALRYNGFYHFLVECKQ
ncbi:piggyBac transposable element-derived protein 3-like, partial [Lepeophtheirus salmonis]|uniref:piggyBac transposable element-derived protein 3-like n=1 Tax=Lepeophtheirus salmonis TaxID=72036 RepID=UPI003AF3DD6B